MNGMEKKIYFDLEKNRCLLLLLVTMAAVPLYYISNDYITTVFAVFAMLYSYNKKWMSCCVGVYIILSKLIGTAVCEVALLFTVIVLFSFHAQGKINRKSIVYSFIIFFFMGISFVLGYKSQMSIMLLAVLSVFLFFICKSIVNKNEYGYIILAFLLAAILIIILIFLLALRGNNVFKYGRLSYDGNIRNVSNACAVPLMFLLNGFILGYRIFSNKLLTVLSTFALIAVTIMTLSRGTIIALIISCSVAFLLSRSGYTKYLRLFVSIAVILLVVYNLQNNSSLHFNHLFSDESGTLNGRTDIWHFYWETMKNGGITKMIFGLGPGDIKRIVTTGEAYYSHSTFLDAFFSYGIIGGIIITMWLISCAGTVIKTRDVLLISVFLGMIMNCATNGTVANFPLYIVIGMLVGLSRNTSMVSLSQEE